MDNVLSWLKELIVDVVDFPKPGILFKDITPLLSTPSALAAVTTLMTERARKLNPDLVVAPEARGFLLATPLAVSLQVGFVPVRKPGKLPRNRISIVHHNEYAKETLEMHVDSVKQGARVLVVDDVLATGGTSSSIEKMVTDMGGTVVSHLFLIELQFLQARKWLHAPVDSLIRY